MKGGRGCNLATARPDDLMDTELWKLSALELAAAVVSGEVSAVEVVDGHLERIAAVNPTVNAVTNLLADSAREAAKETDRRRAGGEPLGRLAGVPFTVKENLDVAGSATTHGVPAFRDAVAAVDAPAVQRLRRAAATPDRARQHARPGAPGTTHRQPALRRHRQPLGRLPHARWNQWR